MTSNSATHTDSSDAKRRTATLVRPDGSTVEITPKGKKFSLAELQAAVGGYIERVRLADGRDMIVNEDGLRLQLPANLEASILARTAIVGNAVIARKGLW